MNSDAKILLFTGQVKSKEVVNPLAVFNKSLEDALALQESGELDGVIWSTWEHEEEEFVKTKLLQVPRGLNFTCISQPSLEDNGLGNIKAQMSTFNSGVYLANEVYSEDCLILKSRPDGYIKPDFIKKVLNLDYSLSSDAKILPHKIWTPWFNMLKPFYLEDSFFASKASSMTKLHNTDGMFVYEKMGQGISHIRRFIYPFLDSYPILKKYISNHLGATFELQRNYSLEGVQGDTLDYFTELYATYYHILDKFFIIKEDGDSITHYSWHEHPFERRFRDELSFTYNSHPSSGDSGGLIYVYNKKWLSKLLSGEFNHDEFSSLIFEKSQRLK